MHIISRFYVHLSRWVSGMRHWVTRPDLETIFETKMVSNWSRDHFETKMSHYLEWRDWFRDHIRDQNSLNSGLETSIDTKMSHSGLQIILDHRSLSSIGQKILMILPEACFDDLEALWRTDGMGSEWDRTAIIGHMYSNNIIWNSRANYYVDKTRWNHGTLFNHKNTIGDGGSTAL